MFLGSDALALAPFTDAVAYLDDGDFVALTRGSASFHDAAGLPVERGLAWALDRETRLGG